ncbi:MAG: hypothetical protein QM535_06055 [Limnohabitans sp.]|nr:hypothetical protein [Limnohabitans sp.]
MSLLIHFLTNDPSLDFEAPNYGSFGFEIWRKTLWGHPIISSLGCQLIPILATKDIYAVEEDLNNLHNELLLLKDNIATITNHTNIAIEDITVRIENALAFTTIALDQETILGVYIG